MKLLVCGNRDWPCELTIFAWLDVIHAQCRRRNDVLVIIEGEGGNADMAAAKWARLRAVQLRPYPADWNPGGIFDPDAGPKRNQKMLDEEHPDRVIGFGTLERPSRRRTGAKERTGTCDMISRANAAGLLVTIVPCPGVMPQ